MLPPYQYVQTDLAEKAVGSYVDRFGGYVPMELVVEGAFELIRDESKAGSCLWITNRRGLEYWPTPGEEAKYLLRSSKTRKKSLITVPMDLQIPHSFEKVVVHTLSHNFRSATRIVRTELRLPLKADHVLLKVIYAGVNASDVNFSSGRYFSGNGKDITSLLPLDSGFEAVGIIAAIGDAVRNLKIGMPAAIMTFGGYAEFVMVPSKHILPVAKPDPEVLAMLTSGLTASIALEKAAQMESGKVVLVTAAAGATGQFAVQLAKLAGNTVIATCGGYVKAKLLKDLGVDRVIDYKVEDIKAVLKKEFPKGTDIVYESVGGEMFDICLNALAVYGRLVVIGMISQAGFFLIQYAHLWQEHLDRLVNLFSSGKLKIGIDPKQFVGLHSVADAVEYLHSGKSAGKV
ncbi:hypothetical protein MTR67_006286 [Solanum verrucosum]|uniref:Enoyl reductase (ER) domain-containing protein n=1 Tax=Solanum verrucosum TaxID=315347 RepID=A0AAF0PXU7_SOLVR|nr:hypothetical protein MTR67_006286 [Solanum verrucosum]